MNRSGSLRSSVSGASSAAAGDSLCSEMSALMHDYETVSRMADLAASLRMPYPELPPDTFRTLLQNIQRSIQVFLHTQEACVFFLQMNFNLYSFNFLHLKYCHTFSMRPLWYYLQ